MRDGDAERQADLEDIAEAAGRADEDAAIAQCVDHRRRDLRCRRGKVRPGAELQAEIEPSAAQMVIRPVRILHQVHRVHTIVVAALGSGGPWNCVARSTPWVEFHRCACLYGTVRQSSGRNPGTIPGPSSLA
jgi:hypothetical protein